MISLYMVRHGETELSNKKVYYGWTDVSLSSNGVKQCELLKNKLININFDAVIASPLKRTLRTAEIISRRNNDDIIKFDDLRELNFGKWEQMHYTDIEQSYSSEWKTWTGDWKNCPTPDGESFIMLYERVEKRINFIIDNYDNKTILLVGHEGVLKIIATILLNMKMEDYWRFTFEFGTYSLLEIQEGITVIRKINS